MSFTATPVDGSSTPIPMSSAVPDGTNTPLAVEAGPSKVTGGNTLAPVAVYQYDGYDVTQGMQADAAVITPASSASVIALLKGLLTELIDIEAQTTMTPTVSGSVSVTNFPGTQPVSGTVTANAGTGSYNNASVGTDGSAIPLSSTLVGGSDGANLQPLQVDASKNLKVNIAAGSLTASNPSVGTDGVAIPTSSTLIGGSDGTNLQPLQVDASKNLKVTVANANANGPTTMVNSAPVTIASNQTNIPIRGDFLEVAGQGTGVVTGNATDLIPATDVSAYKWLSLQLEGTFTLTLSFQWSNDNINFRPLTLMRNDSLAGTNAATSTTATGQGWNGPIFFRYLRVRVTSFVSNASLAGTLELYTNPAAFLFNTTQVAQSGTWTVGLSNGDITVVAPAAYTSTQTQVDQTNTAARGIRVVLDVTVPGTGSVTLEIDAKDTASGKYYPILTGVAVVTLSTTVYTVYPGLTPAANSIASDVLPKTWRIKVTANNANSVTYSVGASYLV